MADEPKSILRPSKHAAEPSAAVDAPSTDNPCISKFIRITWTLSALALLAAIAANLAIRAMVVDRAERFDASGRLVVDLAYLEDIRYPKLMEFVFHVTKPWVVSLSGLSCAAGEAIGRAKAVEFFVDAKEFMLKHNVDDQLIKNLTTDPNFIKLDEESYVRAAMAALDEDFANENVYHLLGRVTMRRFVSQGVMKNVVAQGLMMAFPEIENIPINPIVVTGPPRTMTTHMQSLLALHSNTESMTYVDGDDFYFLSRDFDQMLTDSDHRVDFLKLGMGITSAVLPHFKRMMRYAPFDPYEDISAQLSSLGSEMMPAIAYLPYYNSFWLDENENHQASFKLLKKQQQVMLWQRKLKYGPKYDFAKKRLLMKTPAHLMKIKPLLEVYPNADWVVTHRNPTDVAKSYVPMILYVWGMTNDALYPSASALVDYLLGFIKVKTDICLRDYHLIPEHKVLNVNFAEFIEKNQIVAERVLEFFDVGFDEDLKEKLAKYVSTHSRNGAAKFKYDLESFGVDMDELSNKFSAYVDKFVDKSDEEIKAAFRRV